MPRYVIERTYSIEEDEMPALGQRIKAITAEQFPELVWEHSHVVTDDSGTIKSFCVYEAPSAEMVRSHAAVVGAHQVDHVYEIGGDVTPADIPT
jgi:Protein of unknown function (DUF4242)